MDIRVGWPPEFVARMQAPGREVTGEEREEILEALREAFSEEPEEASLTQAGFDDALGKALRLCRLAADLELPIEAMLEHVADGIEARYEVPYDAATERELEALREIIAAVGEVAAIGAGLAGQEGAKLPGSPTTAPEPLERSFPLPANLTAIPRVATMPAHEKGEGLDVKITGLREE